MYSILKCKRCGHEWPTKDVTSVRVCPKCHSPWWDKEKKIKLVFKA
jgi:predicted Zn-ribbon and HTH transcriptional regulator